MSQTNISDISRSTLNQGGALLLPIRSEKQFLTSSAPDDPTNPGQPMANYHVVAALKPYSTYVMVRLPGRGGDPGVFDPTDMAVYQFLINPAEAQIQRQTIDEQSNTRVGWQIGVWGEDFIAITLNGKSPGKYFSQGLTDFLTPYTQSYRNLAALELVVENNGYWFEGEEVGSTLEQSVRRIKMHQDVELVVGDFIWDGMFETLELTEDADSPYLVDFSLTFVAWKERFRSSSPYTLYGNLIGGEVQSGHVPLKVTAPQALTTASTALSTQDPQTTTTIAMQAPVSSVFNQP